MTLHEALGFEPSPPNLAQRAVQRLAATRGAAWALSRLLTPVDRLVLRLTMGRMTAAGLLAGVPVITVTTTGARTGLPRSSPLVGIPLDASLAIVGTNFGQRRTPDWVRNLEADPGAEVTYRTATVPVQARPPTEGEYELVFQRAIGLYPGYGDYRERVTGRAIRVFVLEHTP